jgi:methionyl-tRNA formyltransferase
MSNGNMDVVFLGVNNIGWDIYQWLCDRESVTVHGLVTNESQLDLVEQFEPDVAVAAGFGNIVPPEILDIPTEGCVNVHPGYLPHLRGYYPNVWSIIKDRPAGASIHYMTEDIDAGDIIARTEVAQHFDDSGRTLYRRIVNAAVELFKDTWPDIESGTVKPIEQDDKKATSHLQREFDDLCVIDPSETYTARELVDVLRALTFPPFDNAYMEVDGEKYYIEVDIYRESDTTDDEQVGFISSS